MTDTTELRISKIKNNRLLNRVQMIVNAYHSPNVKLSKEMIKEKIKEKYKKQYISIFGMKKLYGGGRTRCFALVYDSEDAMKKFEPKSRIKRSEPKENKPKGKKEGRKVNKVKKHQKQKKRGTARRQDLNLKRKQNKKKK